MIRKTCPGSPGKLLHKALLFESRSSFDFVNGSSDILQCSAQTAKTGVANEIGNVPGFVELDSSSSTFG